MTMQVLDSREVVRELMEWYATPSEFREEKTLSQLADRMGVSSKALLAHLQRVPQGGHQLLSVVALGAVHGVPRVMEKLLEAVEAGSIYAADVYLDFVRKTLTDGALLAVVQDKPKDAAAVIQEVTASAEKLLQAAKNLGHQEVRVGIVHTQGGLEARTEVAILGEVGKGRLDLTKHRPVPVPEESPGPDR